MTLTDLYFILFITCPILNSESTNFFTIFLFAFCMYELRFMIYVQKNQFALLKGQNFVIPAHISTTDRIKRYVLGFSFYQIIMAFICALLAEDYHRTQPKIRSTTYVILTQQNSLKQHFFCDNFSFYIGVICRFKNTSTNNFAHKLLKLCFFQTFFTEHFISFLVF